MIIDRKYLRGVSLRDTSIPRIYLRGEAGGAPISFEGYPLELDLPNARSMRTYTLFGNTSEDAKGVGDEVVQMKPALSAANYNPSYYGNGNITYADGIATITQTSGFFGLQSIGTTSVVGHKFFCAIEAKANKNCLITSNGGGISPFIYGDIITTEWKKFFRIVDGTSSSGWFNNQYDEGQDYVLNLRKYQLFDLTAIYGAGNEPSTADEFAHRLGYADAEHLPAFPYGSSFVAPIRVGSRNIWDEEWEAGTWNTNTGQKVAFNNRIRCANFVSVKPNTAYFFRANYSNWRILEYSSNKTLIKTTNLISGGVITTSAETRFVTFYWAQDLTSYDGGVCVNLSDEHNGEYSPYFAPTLYPSVLSSPLHKIGDIVDYKESNGKEWHGLERGKMKDFGWERLTSGSTPYFRMRIPAKKDGATNLFSSEYTIDTRVITEMDDKTIKGNPSGPYIYVKDSRYATAAEFKAHFTDEDFIVYELATPTEVQGEPLPRLAIPKGESIVTLDTEVEPSNITAKV